MDPMEVGTKDKLNQLSLAHKGIIKGIMRAAIKITKVVGNIFKDALVELGN